MIDPTNFMLFLAASWALIIAPGPDIIYVVTRGVSQGRKAALLSAVGVTLGILVHTLFAALGLSVILRTSALAFLVVKYVGAVYLIYLGVKTLLDKSSLTPIEAQEHLSPRSILWQGMLSNVLNPKVALFFLAFLPQFVNQANGYVPLQMFTLGLIFAFFGVIFLLALAFFAGQVGNWLAGKQKLADTLRWLTGVILIGLGLRLALTQRK